ncbi:MAG: hypothetical protein HOP16_16935 [Acidobacteria bacterium]|nr:hypothetical protein [Acidobacteriota bacterium]
MRIPRPSSVALAASVVAFIAAVAWAPTRAAQTFSTAPASHTGPLFQSATQCMACHNGLTTPSGEDVSMGTMWRASMMAHSARDPYWHAGVRREVTDHPTAQAAIENECSRCHMPMAHVQNQTLNRQQTVFANIAAVGGAGAAADPLAVEGVSCSLCHQIADQRLGEKSSFTGGFVVDTSTPAEQRRLFGPFDVDAGRTSVMRSVTGFQPTASPHIQRSEVCATCHTLYTHALNAAGEPIGGEFPEQVPYQEWLHSEFKATQSCQSCHMPTVAQPTPIASVLGEPREAVSRHDFRGANFFMLSILNRFRTDLAVVAQPVELDNAIARTKAYLQTAAATVAIESVTLDNGRLDADIVVRNLSGHKLPTAYPSRRVWLRVAVRDQGGRVVFESGAVEPTGAITGNDNDMDGTRFEPHYEVVDSPDKVQIYEPILGTPSGAVTTGLLSATRYLKDNRVAPRGFDKATAPADVAVEGGARSDADFLGGQDRVHYRVDVGGAAGPFTIDAEVWYQSIGYRWAENLRGYTAAEPQRFVRYYEAMAPASAIRLAGTAASTSGAR